MNKKVSHGQRKVGGLGAPTRRFRGYDIFISYARKDASLYAEQLRQGLEEKGFTVFLDREVFEAGQKLEKATKSALKHSRHLIVLCSGAAFESPYVLDEVTFYSTLDRKIIPIDFEHRLKSSPESALGRNTGESIWLDEADLALQVGPTTEVLTGVQNSVRGTKVKTRERLILIAALITFLAITLVGLSEYRSASSRGLVTRSDELASEATQSLDPALALLLGVESLNKAVTPISKAALLHSLQENVGLQLVLHGSDTPPSLAFDPTGHRLAAAHSKGITIWDVQSGKVVVTLKSAKPISTIVYIPDGKAIVAAMGEDVLILAPDTLTTLDGPLQFSETISSVAVSPNSKILAVGTSQSVHVLDLATRAELWPELGSRRQNRPTVALSFSFDGHLLAATDGSYHLWDLVRHTAVPNPISVPQVGKSLDVIEQARPGTTFRTVKIEPRVMPVIATARFSPSEPILAVGMNFGPDSSENDALGIVYLWDMNANSSYTSEPILDGSTISDVQFSSDGQQFAIATIDGMINTWGTYQRVLVSTFRAPRIRAIALNSTGEMLATSALYSGVELWDQRDSHGHRLGDPKQGDISAAVFSQDGRTVAYSQNGQVQLIDIASGAPAWGDEGFSHNAVALAINKDATVLASADTGGKLFIHHKGSHQQIPEINAGRIGVSVVAIRTDGSLIASGSIDGTPQQPKCLIRLWDGVTGNASGEFEKGITCPIVNLQFSQDGRILTSATSDGAITEWSVDERKITKFLVAGQPYAVRTMARNERAQAIVVGRTDNQAVLFDLKKHFPSEAPASISLAQNNAVYAAAFSPDGAFIATGDSDGNVTLWDASSHSRIATYRLLRTPVVALSFAANGEQLFAAGQGEADGFASWPLDPKQLRGDACLVANRNLTCEEWDEFLPSEQYKVTCRSVPAGCTK